MITMSPLGPANGVSVPTGLARGVVEHLVQGQVIARPNHAQAGERLRRGRAKRVMIVCMSRMPADPGIVNDSCFSR